MSILTLFTKQTPTLAGVELDAWLEDELEINVTMSRYPLENGAEVADHRVLNPIRWTIVGGISNNSLKPSVTDFTGLLTNIAPNSAILSTIGGLASGFLSSSPETRASNALQALITIAATGTPFDVDAGDIQLHNMVIVNLRRRKTPENEQALMFEAQLQELPLLNTVLTNTQAPSRDKLSKDDQQASFLTRLKNKGEQIVKSLEGNISNAQKDILNAANNVKGLLP